MSNNSNPDNPPNNKDATLALVIQSMKEHEQSLDKLIRQLAELKPQIDSTKELHNRFEEIEKKLSTLEKEIKNLTNYLTTKNK